MEWYTALGLVLSLTGNIIQYVKKSSMERAFRALTRGVQAQLGVAVRRASELVTDSIPLGKPTDQIDYLTLRQVHIGIGDLRGNVEGARANLEQFTLQYLPTKRLRLDSGTRFVAAVGDPRVYMIRDGIRHWIESAELLHQLGQDRKDVPDFQEDIVFSIPEGTKIDVQNVKDFRLIATAPNC